ncbi:hypothetical protein [Apibacter adventoris]|uniref:hypothetical protein n=1 Tax=Apibacter adventoris TaxID=1679466 RepID=UPI0015E444F1|nr:hypothetical protein [Apibacter adventoris]
MAQAKGKTNEKLVLEKFKVEELEKRYEMGWGRLSPAIISTSDGETHYGGKWTINF